MFIIKILLGLLVLTFFVVIPALVGTAARNDLTIKKIDWNEWNFGMVIILTIAILITFAYSIGSVIVGI